MLMKAGPEPARALRPPALRFIASVGEPLNPEAVWWGQEVLGPADPRQLVADRDRRHHDRQLRRRMDIKPGSMGRPLPGIEAAIVAPQAEGGARRASSSAPDVEGELALRAGWPSMFRGYLTRRSATASASPAAGT